MSPVRRIVSLVSFGLLLAVASGCTGPRVSQADIEAARAITANATPPTRLVTVTPRPAGSKPIVVQASSGRAPTTTPVPADTLIAPTSLRVPTSNRTMVTVNSTDGEGLWVRREPAGEPVRIWPDGSPMLVVGEDVLAEERFWRQVKTLDGHTGWAAAEFLVPADEQTLAAAMAAFNQPQPAVQAPPTLGSGLQARVAGAVATATAATAAPTATRRPASFAGQGAAPTATPRTATTITAASQPATQSIAQPTATAQQSATPVRAPAGATSFDVDDSTLALLGKDHGMPIKIGSRPRDGMELVAVHVRITNRGSEPLAVYRGAFRLALADRSRVEPLAGGESPVPYSATVQPGDALEGWLTFEAPKDARLDSLIWSPDHGTAYALGL